MSYSRSYSRTVTQSYSKTVSVSYPKSESSGTKSVTVSGTVEIPVNIEIYVDTERFDSSVNGCKNSVNILNTAVVTTTAEEIAAKSQASKRIGKAAVDGFFQYISSELSLLRSELSAKCNSLLATLFTQKEDCANKASQMRDDYERISNRYGSLFTDLDNEMQSRIRAIDAPIFKVNQELNLCSSRSVDTSLLGVATVLATETAQIDAILAASTIKNRAKELIDQANNFLSSSYYLQNRLKDMLIEDDGTQFYMLPIIYVESSEDANCIKRKIYGSSTPLLQKNVGIDTDLEERFQSSDIEWDRASSLYEEQIDPLFNNKLNESNIDSRTAKVMIELKTKNVINVIKNN